MPDREQRRPSGTRRRLLAGIGVCLSGVLAGCTTNGDGSGPSSDEGRITIRLQNRDSTPRSYEVVVEQGNALRNSFSGTLPADQAESTEMIGTVRITDTQYEFKIRTDAGQVGRTWDPAECDASLVDGVVEDGEAEFETSCQSESS